MKYSLVLLSMFFTPYAVSMHHTSITIANQSNQIVCIAYREPACAILEKVLPHTCLTLASTTPFLAIMNNQGRIERFPMQHRNHYFIIAAVKNSYKNELKISEYDDQSIARSKDNYSDDGHNIFQ